MGGGVWKRSAATLPLSCSGDTTVCAVHAHSFSGRCLCRAYKERLRAVDPIWNQKYDTKPMGAVPDFNLLHKWVAALCCVCCAFSLLPWQRIH